MPVRKYHLPSLQNLFFDNSFINSRLLFFYDLPKIRDQTFRRRPPGAINFGRGAITPFFEPLRIYFYELFVCFIFWSDLS